MRSLVAWWRRLRSVAAEPAGEARWVVVDCETSGLDISADRLLSIGALAVRRSRIDFADCHGVLLRQERASDAANILIHGIGGEAQAGGADPAESIARFAQFAGDAPLVAFHAAFDRAMLERAARGHGLRWKRPWLDLAELLPLLFAESGKRARSLDDWLDAFEIAHPARHDALGDAYATAQLMLAALPRAALEGFVSVGEVLGAAASAKWMRR